MQSCRVTKRKTGEPERMEAHRKYADLQYIVDGEERIYVDFADELETEEDAEHLKKILFFIKREKIMVIIFLIRGNLGIMHHRMPICRA